MTTADLLLALIAILAAAKIFGTLAQRIGQPAVLGELVGGVVIGVSGLRLVNPSDNTIHLLSELGVIILLFLIGLETDLNKLLAVGGSAVVVAVVGVALPFVGGALAGYFLALPKMVAFFLGATLTATSVGITARVLSDLGHLKDAEAQIILGAAVVDDIIGLILLTLVSRVAGGGNLSAVEVIRVIVIAFGFVALAILLGARLAPRLMRVIERLDIARGLFFASMMFAFLLAYLAEHVGSALIIGSFAAGLVLARTRKAEQIEREVHDIGEFFIPIFFVAVGAAINLSSLNPFNAISRHYLIIGLILTLVGVLGKVVSGFCVPRRDVKRIVIGVGMIPRGEVGLIFAQIGLTAGLLNAGLYSAVTLMVMLTTFMTPPLLRALLVRGVPAELHGACDFVMDAPSDTERRPDAESIRDPGDA
jgi:Kef-type K+ transport system membrane component KefB